MFCESLNQSTDNDIHHKPYLLNGEQCVPEEWTVPNDDLTWHSQECTNDAVYHIPDNTPSLSSTELDNESCSTTLMMSSDNIPQKVDSQLVSESMYNDTANDISQTKENKMIDSITKKACVDSFENSTYQNSSYIGSQHDEINHKNCYHCSQNQTLDSHEVSYHSDMSQNVSLSQTTSDNNLHEQDFIAKEATNKAMESSNVTADPKFVPLPPPPPPTINIGTITTSPTLCHEVQLSQLSNFRFSSSSLSSFSFTKPLSPLNASQIRSKLSNSNETRKLPPALRLKPIEDSINYQNEDLCTLDPSMKCDLEPHKKRLKITGRMCDDGGMNELYVCNEEKVEGNNKQESRIESDIYQLESQTNIATNLSMTSSLNNSISNCDSNRHMCPPVETIQQISLIETVLEHPEVPDYVTCHNKGIEVLGTSQQAQSIHTVPTSTTSTITTTNSQSVKNASSPPTATSMITTDDLDEGTLYSLPLTTHELLSSDIKNQAFRHVFPTWQQRAAYSRSFLG